MEELPWETNLPNIVIKINKIIDWVNETDKIIDNLNEFNEILVKKLKDNKDK